MRLQPGTLRWMVWWNEEGGSRLMPGPPFLVSLEPLERSGSLLGGEGLAPCRPEGDGDGLVPVGLPVGAGVPLHLGGVLADRGSVVGPPEVLVKRLEPLEKAATAGAAPVGVAVLLEGAAGAAGVLHDPFLRYAAAASRRRRAMSLVLSPPFSSQSLAAASRASEMVGSHLPRGSSPG